MKKQKRQDTLERITTEYGTQLWMNRSIQVEGSFAKIGTGGTDMNNTMEYKGYIGSVEFSEADQILFGKVQGIRSLISYEGTTVSELINDFHGAVDNYLALCD